MKVKGKVHNNVRFFLLFCKLCSESSSDRMSKICRHLEKLLRKQNGARFFLDIMYVKCVAFEYCHFRKICLIVCMLWIIHEITSEFVKFNPNTNPRANAKSLILTPTLTLPSDTTSLITRIYCNMAHLKILLKTLYINSLFD